MQQAEAQRKSQKDQADAAIAAQRVENEQARVVLDAKSSELKIDADTKRQSDNLDLEIFKAVTGQNKGQ